MEKIFIVSILSLGMLTYYIIPFNVLLRLYILSSSLCTALFPVFSALTANNSKSHLAGIVSKSIKILSALAAWISLWFILSANDFLTIWLGRDFALNAISYLQILSIAFWINILAQVPFAYLRAWLY